VCESEFLLSTDKSKCNSDKSCLVRDCAACVADRSVCEACKTGFWKTPANFCIDGTCQVDGCKVCNEKGPSVCDSCKEGHMHLNGLCINTVCSEPGYKFNFATNRCEDTACKIEFCSSCTNSGIFGCDMCQNDYVYEIWSKRCVFDDSCRVKGCANCEGDVKKCKVCAVGLWYDAASNTCIDASCKVGGCRSCQKSGPLGCDACSPGFLKTDGSTCTKCSSKGCLTCTDAGALCTKCEQGMILTNGVCKGCDKDLCLDCDAKTGLCGACK